MKKYVLLLTLIGVLSAAYAQDENVSLSDVSNNNGYSNYDQNTKIISGIFFEILSDGDNADHIISDFEVSLYLVPCDNSGSPTNNTPIIIKTYQITEMQQLHAIEYENESVDLSQVANLKDGAYRLGVWVNSNLGVSKQVDDMSDNASLIRSNHVDGDIIYFSAVTRAGLNSNSMVDYAMYPNPFRTEFFLDMKSENLFRIRMYDMFGKEVRNEIFVQAVTLLRNNLAEGVYIVKVSDKSGNDVLVKKITVAD